MNASPNGPLRNLERDVVPPAELKARVSQSLRSRGLLRPRWTGGARAGSMLAAALTLFVAGRITAGGGRPGDAEDGRHRYALLLYEDSGFDRQTPGDTYIAEYARWAQTLRERGAFVDGNPLAPTAQLIAGAGNETRIEPRDVSSEAGVMAGDFIVRAATDAEALAIARTCPHLRHGGRIAVRPVIPS